MPRNRYVESLLALADELASHPGSPHLRQAAMRRAVSSAYYALFHALCTLCTDALVGVGAPTDMAVSIYRALDHGTARKRLLAVDRTIAPDVARIGTIFDELQRERHVADYAQPALHFTPNRTAALVELAREAVALLASLDKAACRRLAVLLVVSRRAP